MSTLINNRKFVLSFINKQNIFDSIKKRISMREKGCSIIVPHICSNNNIFTGSFAGYIAEYYPIVKENYHMSIGSQKLGNTQFVETYTEPLYRHKIIFANMIAQNGLRSVKNPRPINYAALVYSMSMVKNYIKNFKNNNENTSVELHCPKFGCGSSGGDWNLISKLIEDIWLDINNVYIYVK